MTLVEHSKNGFPLIIVTDSGMVTDCKDSQSKNAPSPMLVTESGMVTECKELKKPPFETLYNLALALPFLA